MRTRIDKLQAAIQRAVDDEHLTDEQADAARKASAAVSEALWPSTRPGTPYKPPKLRDVAKAALEAADELLGADLPEKHADKIQDARDALKDHYEADGAPLAGQEQPAEEPYPREAGRKGITTATGRMVFRG